MSRQPSSPDLSRISKNPEELSLAALSAKQTFMGGQIERLIDNQKITHQALIDGFASIAREMEKDREERHKENAKTRASHRLWSTLGTGVVVTALRVTWERLVDAWHALIR